MNLMNRLRQAGLVGLILLTIALGASLTISKSRNREIAADNDRLHRETEIAQRDTETAQREANAARTQTARLARVFQLNYQALEAQKAEYDRHRQETTADRAVIREVCANDKTAETWALTPVPADVAARLCGDPGPVPLPGADIPAAPGRLPPGCAGAPVTNGDLVDWTLALRQALRQSNSDKAALRKWMATAVISAEK